MRRNFKIAIIPIIALLASRPALGFDREVIHAASFSGMNLSHRQSVDRASSATFSLSSSFSDLLISDINHPARFSQDNVSVLSLSGGEWLTAWEDTRLGAEKIFWTKLNGTGSRVGVNMIVAGSTVGDDLVEPHLLQDSRGKVYLFYRNQTSGEIFASRFNGDLTIDRPAVLVNDTSAGAYAGPFDAALFPDGRVVIVWENYGASSQTISMRIYDSAGVSQLGPAAVPSDISTTQKWVPSVAIDPSSGFLVAWEDYRNGQADIYARQFSGSGTPVGADFSIVPPPSSDFAQYAPRVAFCGADKYVIGWHDRRQGQEIFIQQYHPVTGLVGVNRLISTPDTLTTNWDLNLSVSPAGTMTATWGTFGAANNIMSLRFAAGLVPIGTPTPRNLTSTGRRWSPGVSYATNTRYATAWTEFQNEDANINLMLFDTAATRVLVAEVTLNDDQVGSPSTHPDIAVGTDWYDLVVFESRRHDAGDIYCQAVSAPGIKPDYNQKVSQDTGASLQSEPAIASGNGKSLVVWVDSRPLAGVAGQRIFGRFGSSIGYFTENEFCISDTLQAAVKSSPKARIAKTGRTLIVWLDKRSGNLQVWGRWLTSTGALDAAEFQISNAGADLNNDELSLSVDTLGRFYVVWLDRAPAAPTVKCRWYSADKSAGGSFSWAPNFGINISEMAVDDFSDGNVGVLWTGVDSIVNRLYFAVLTPGGSLVRQLLDITDHPQADAEKPAVSIAENGYVSAGWVDHRAGNRRVYYQVFDAALSPLDINQPVSAATPEFMTSPVTHTSRGRAWFAWVDPRANGLQVYLANTIYLPTGVDDPNTALPSEYRLEQNYPNPFNPSTTIEFALPRAANVTLTIFNLLGREVTRLADDQRFLAGTHRIVWDGLDQSGNQTASGVYFYRLTAGDFTEQRKMILVK